MEETLTPPMHPWHEHALSVSIARLREQPRVLAVLLQGSVARGDAAPGADLDLVVVLEDGQPPGFSHRNVAGVRVEEHRASLSDLRTKLAKRPGVAYGIVEARLVHGPPEIEAAVRQCAEEALATFRLDSRERARLAYWLVTSAEKAEAAAEAGDLLRAALVVDASLWPLVEGLWGVNGRPAPPVGAVLAHLPALREAPPEVESRIDRLLLGDPSERAAAFAELATWVGAALEEAGATEAG